MNSNWLRPPDGKDLIALPTRKPRTDYITEISSYFLHRPRLEKLCPMNTILNKIEIGHSSIQGYRPHMEDQYVAQTLDDLEDHVLVAVMDGHAGPGAAQFTSRRLPSIIAQTEQFRQYVSMDVAARADVAGMELLSAALVQAYLNMDAEYERYDQRDNSGSTAICAIISPSHIHCANVGDSRCVIGSSAGTVTTMSEDHKPSLTEENARIERAGGFVLMDRVMGELAMSRAMGDYQYKRTEGLGPGEQMVSCVPDVCVHRRDPSDDLLILACDGVWDVMSSADSVSYLQDMLAYVDDEVSVESKSHPAAELEITALGYANALVEMAFSEGSTDNITAVIVKLRSAGSVNGSEQQRKQLLSEVKMGTCISANGSNCSGSNSSSSSVACESVLLAVPAATAELPNVASTEAQIWQTVEASEASETSETAVLAQSVLPMAGGARYEGTESDSSSESVNGKKRKFETADE